MGCNFLYIEKGYGVNIVLKHWLDNSLDLSLSANI